MARITVGSKIPNLVGNVLSGYEIGLEDYIGDPLILSFYRYAGCQFCNLRMHNFIKKFNDEYEPQGINAIAVFQSPIRKLQKYTSEHQAPFEIVSDPKYKWYKAFGVERSWSGMMKAGLNVKGLVDSVAKGYARVDPDGHVNRIPADFLISESGIIDIAYYGDDISDHIPFSRIDKWIKSTARVKS